MKKFIYLTIIFSALQVVSVQKLWAYDAAISLGNICEYVGKIQTDDSGSKNICSFKPFVSAELNAEINKYWLISPEAGLSFPQSGRDENIKKMSLFVLMNSLYRFNSFYILGGAGLYLNRISATGGFQELNNGNSSVSFPMPDSTVYTRNFILDLGLGTFFSREISAEIKTYVFNALTSEDRAFSVVFNGTYHFGEL